MDLKLNGKVAIVTGGSRNIGAAIVMALAAEGVKVIVNYAGRKDRADQVVSEVVANGGQAIAVQADVSKAGDVKKLFEAAKNEFGTIDIIVNNAGIYEFDAIEAVTEEKFQRHFNINVWGPFLTTQEALKFFPESGGNIINISSGASEHPEAETSLYSATKAALDVLTKAWSKELADRNIRVNTVAPGVMENDGNEEAFVAEDEMEKHIIAMTPLGRLGKPEDIAKVVVLVASDAAAWITGDRINVSGGLFF
jgi:3-oxoacyl-[acyl-carrier protein] reductase